MAFFEDFELQRGQAYDEIYCQVHFLHETFFGVSVKSLLIRRSDGNMLHNTCKRGDFSIASYKSADKQRSNTHTKRSPVRKVDQKKFQRRPGLSYHSESPRKRPLKKRYFALFWQSDSINNFISVHIAKFGLFGRIA